MKLLLLVSIFSQPVIAQTNLFTISGPGTGLNTPRDLQFNPYRPNELWVVNRQTDSTSIIFNPGQANQEIDVRTDKYSMHFMEEVSSIDFNPADGFFATCHESRNTYNDRYGANDFMGPTLWTSDLNIYARVNQRFSDSFFSRTHGSNSDYPLVCGTGSLAEPLQGSHMDMLHQSPLCMGIAHDVDNVYWVFDGFNGHVVRYDFKKDHGPGGSDHSDGVVRRYTEAKIKRVSGIPSHMKIHRPTGMLYIADTGNHRILRLDTKSGRRSRSLRARSEPLAEFSEYKGVKVDTFVKNIKSPSGLHIYNDQVYVTEHQSGDVVIFDLEGKEVKRFTTEPGIMGITVSPTGKIWFVNGLKNTVNRIDEI